MFMGVALIRKATPMPGIKETKESLKQSLMPLASVTRCSVMLVASNGKAEASGGRVETFVRIYRDKVR
jgi:hypothetical protein